MIPPVIELFAQRSQLEMNNIRSACCYTKTLDTKLIDIQIYRRVLSISEMKQYLEDNRYCIGILLVFWKKGCNIKSPRAINVLKNEMKDCKYLKL